MLRTQVSASPQESIALRRQSEIVKILAKAKLSGPSLTSATEQCLCGLTDQLDIVWPRGRTQCSIQHWSTNIPETTGLGASMTLFGR